MLEFHELAPEKLSESPFKLIGKDWMLVTAEKDGKVNAMTASWGGLGVMWGKNVAFIVIRPQRYTKQFLDSSDTFSLTFYEETMKKQLSYFGSVSGRDENKIEKSGFTLEHDGNTPYFSEARIALICKKLFAQDYQPECFLSHDIEKWYPDKDYHMLYIAEITKILVK
ncbi:MAG: flavin reductase [Bacillota bacterium]|nr:flavin reductase [Bacillota bacterium]